MTNENLLPQAKRIPHFVGIETPPQLFFTVNDGRHAQSMKIIDALAEAYRNNGAITAVPSCITYDSWDAMPKHLSDNSVLIFDEKLGSNCFSPPCWELNACRRQFLHFQRIEVLWGFAVNACIDESRIATAVNQLKADFGTNFLKRLNEGKFPWGDRPKLQIAEGSSSRKRHRKWRTRRRDGDPLYNIYM